MKTLARLFIIGTIASIVAVGFIAWKYPDKTYRAVRKGIAEYRQSIHGPYEIIAPGSWEKAEKGLYFRRFNIKRENESFSLKLMALRIDPDSYRFKVITVPHKKVNETPITAIAVRNKAHAVINASFFNDQLGILGLVIADGKQVSSMTVAGENRGIFAVQNGRPRLVHRDRFTKDGATQAIQSGPWLISNGKIETKFRHPDEVHRRSAIGTDRKGRIILIITDTMANGITLPNLAKLMADKDNLDLGCQWALNLDGGTSSQMLLWTDQEKRFVRGFVNVPVFIAAIPIKGGKK